MSIRTLTEPPARVDSHAREYSRMLRAAFRRHDASRRCARLGTMFARAVLVSLILASASATHCTTYPCICDDNLEQPSRDDGVCVKVGKPCAGSECHGVRPHISEAECGLVAEQAPYAEECDGTPEEQCWTWCPLPTDAPTAGPTVTSTSTTNEPVSSPYSYSYAITECVDVEGYSEECSDCATTEGVCRFYITGGWEGDRTCTSWCEKRGLTCHAMQQSMDLVSIHSANPEGQAARTRSTRTA